MVNGSVVNQYDTIDTARIILTDIETINKSKFGNLKHPLQNAFALQVTANNAIFFYWP